MVDFRDNPWLGETLHVARENGVTISLICHAPIAVTSTRQRIDAQGAAYSVKDNPFLAASIATVPKMGELFALSFLYPHVPGKKTRLPYFVDVAIKQACGALRCTEDTPGGLSPEVLQVRTTPTRRSWARPHDLVRSLVWRVGGGRSGSVPDRAPNPRLVEDGRATRSG
ncbi:hypothetical protein [Streptomyces stackebrandtii]|uniref:hypothetical protein n=1 Tax=Streptomyces stackebrandtii TaxID=3051177 RepID=UPI0028DC4011|nr:hypothetical protein [Streptomyces sp. DSM 40976]